MDLLKTFNRDSLKKASGDVFGKIYEYFLNKFAQTGAQEGGEFFTPPSLVRLIVGIIEPDRGTVFDPACGSGGMVGHHASALSQGPGIVVGRKDNVGSIFYSPVPFFAIDTVYFIRPEQTTFFLLHTLQRMNFISSDAAVPRLISGQLRL